MTTQHRRGVYRGCVWSEEVRATRRAGRRQKRDDVVCRGLVVMMWLRRKRKALGSKEYVIGWKGEG